MIYGVPKGQRAKMCAPYSAERMRGAAKSAARSIAFGAGKAADVGERLAAAITAGTTYSEAIEIVEREAKRCGLTDTQAALILGAFCYETVGE